MLARAGIHAEAGEDVLTVCGGVPRGGAFVSYNDHRMVMSAAVLAAYARGAVFDRGGIRRGEVLSPFL